MWFQGLLSILRYGLQLWSGLLEASEKEKIKQDGKNEQTIENISIVNNRKSRARAIIERLRRQDEADSNK